MSPVRQSVPPYAVLPWRDGGRPLRLPCGAMWASRPTDILRAGAGGASGRRPLRSSIGKRFVGVGLPDDPHRTCTKLLALRRAGCPQPAVRQLPHPPGRARGPCPTKILRITPGGQGRPPLRRNALQGGTHVSRRTPHPLQKTLSLAWRSTSHGLQLPAAAPAIRAPDRGMQQLIFLYRKQIFDAAGARPAHPFIVKKPTGLYVS